MQNNLIHRIVILIAFAISMIFFVVQISADDADFLDAVFVATFVMLIVSIILLIALQCVVKILFEHLSERRKQVEALNGLNSQGKGSDLSNQHSDIDPDIQRTNDGQV